MFIRFVIWVRFIILHCTMPEIQSGTVDTAKNGTIDLDGDKKLDEIVLELTNTNHKSISVTYTLDLD